MTNVPPAPPSQVVLGGAPSTRHNIFLTHAVNLHASVGFEGQTLPGTTRVSHVVTQQQVVTQQDGEATLTLSGYVPPGEGTLQVVVANDPSSPAVGVNVGAVHQTVTFANGESEAAVKVPILAGAPNPGEVDVDFIITPIDPPPNLIVTFPLERLKILASPALIPPRIASSQGTPQGIVLTFSKPMDPAGASNLNDYAVKSSVLTSKQNPFWVPFNYITFPLLSAA